MPTQEGTLSGCGEGKGVGTFGATAGVEGHPIASLYVAAQLLQREQRLLVGEADVIHTLGHLGSEIVDRPFHTPLLICLV